MEICIRHVMYPNLELSEWFMIKSKQQPLMSLCNLFKYLFLCMRAFTACSLRCIHESPKHNVYVYFFILRVTLNTFRHISTCSKTKERKNLMPAFLIHFTIFFSYFYFFVLFLPAVPSDVRMGASPPLRQPPDLSPKRKNTTQQRQSHHDRRKCGESFS